MFIRSIEEKPFEDEDRAVSAGEDKTLRIWDLKSGQCLATVPAAFPCSSLSVISDSLRAVSGHNDGYPRATAYLFTKTGCPSSTFTPPSSASAIFRVRRRHASEAGPRTCLQTHLILTAKVSRTGSCHSLCWERRCQGSAFYGQKMSGGSTR